MRVRGRFGADLGANLGAFGGSPGANLGPFFEHRFRYGFRKPPGSVSEPFSAPKMDPKRHPKGPRRSPEREVQIRQKSLMAPPTAADPSFLDLGPPGDWELGEARVEPSGLAASRKHRELGLQKTPYNR